MEPRASVNRNMIPPEQTVEQGTDSASSLASFTLVISIYQYCMTNLKITGFSISVVIVKE